MIINHIILWLGMSLIHSYFFIYVFYYFNFFLLIIRIVYLLLITFFSRSEVCFISCETSFNYSYTRDINTVLSSDGLYS
jgi:hypothetical protein